jgi:K+-sensing histidine kinase KdpD
MRLEGGVQSIFLELLHNAARYGAGRLLVKTAYDPKAERVHIYFYNNGQPTPEEQWDQLMEQEVSEDGRGFGLADARYIIENLNGGSLRFAPSDRQDFSVLLVIELRIIKSDSIIE